MSKTAASALTIIDIALDTSADAAFAALHSLSDDNGDCGGAWVVVPRQPGWAALLGALNTHSIKVDKHHTGGLAVHILAGLSIQSRLPKEKGCAAFRKTLVAHGFEAHVYSYAD